MYNVMIACSSGFFFFFVNVSIVVAHCTLQFESALAYMPCKRGPGGKFAKCEVSMDRQHSCVSMCRVFFVQFFVGRGPLYTRRQYRSERADNGISSTVPWANYVQ